MIQLKRLFPFVIGALLLFVPVAAVSAHALFLRSNPAPNELLDTAPALVEIWVTEPVELGFTEVKVISISGERVDVDDTQVNPDDPLHITVGLRSLADGVYTVSWQALSVVDGHITLGTSPFAVGSVDPAALAAAGGASMSVVAANPGEIIPRWLTIIGAALVIGGYVFRSYVWEPVWRTIHPDAGASVIERRFDQLRQLGVIIFLGSSGAALFWHIQVATSLPPWFAVLNFSMTE